MGQGQSQGGKGQLTQRQRELKDRLGKLQQQMREKGAGGGSPNQLSQAEKAMEDAENALEQGDLDEATQQQGRALEQMRQGAQSMAQEMMRNMPQRYGQSGDTPRDPLGRPQRSQGPDLGTSVKVPDQIDIQRAREILEELRRRLGESTRGTQELDYLERLLRRF
jgi:DNA anti-recombination protein RmuC